jgi:putative methyltransferase (TIGR04325 family)
MRVGLKRFLRLLLPGFVPELVERMRPAERLYHGPGWPLQVQSCWNDESSEEVMRRNWPTVLARIEGVEPLSMLPYRSDQPDLPAHNMLMTFLYVLARAAHRKDDLSVLDWGGALGHFALVARRMLPDIELEYVVKEQAVNCRLAAELNPSVTFVDSDDECFSRTYDVVVSNGALHYVEHWKPLVGRLAAASRSWLLLNAVPIVHRVPSFVVVQRLRSAGFRGEFYSNAINRDEFLDAAARQGMVLVRELMAWGPVSYKGAPEDPVGAGFLFKRG